MRPVLTDEQVREMKRLRDAGHYLHEIAKRFRVSTATAHNYVNDITLGRKRELKNVTE